MHSSSNTPPLPSCANIGHGQTTDRCGQTADRWQRPIRTRHKNLPRNCEGERPSLAPWHTAASSGEGCSFYPSGRQNITNLNQGGPFSCCCHAVAVCTRSASFAPTARVLSYFGQIISRSGRAGPPRVWVKHWQGRRVVQDLRRYLCPPCAVV